MLEIYINLQEMKKHICLKKIHYFQIYILELFYFGNLKRTCGFQEHIAAMLADV